MIKLFLFFVCFCAIGCCNRTEEPKISQKSINFIYNCEKISKFTKLKAMYNPYFGNGGNCEIHRKDNAPLVIDDERELARIIFILENGKIK